MNVMGLLIIVALVFLIAVVVGIAVIVVASRKKVVRFCKRCGAGLRRRDSFCPVCGESVLSLGGSGVENRIYEE